MKRTPMKRGTSEKTRYKRWGPPGYRKWVESHPCCLCGRRGPSDAHHVVSRSQGGGWMDNLVPLCREHHTEWHTSKTFRARHEFGLIEAAARFTSVYLEQNPEKV